MDDKPPNDRRKGDRHTLADHRLGESFAHVHDDASDHDHDHDRDDLGGPGAPEDNPLWLQDVITLTSVGIDVGSSGTQVLFSRVTLRRLGEELSSRYHVVSRETLFRSPVALTPYLSDTRIDEMRLGTIIDEAYAAAGIHPDTIDAGAVILTGEALRRENAEAIAGVLAEEGGEFVCAAAGHHMEALLAAYGSGAAHASHDRDERILNIDIGGGTTKIALLEDGRVLATAAIHVGGRLQVVDDDGVIVRLDPAGAQHAQRAGFTWKLGDQVDSAALDAVAANMADAVIAAVTERPLSSAVAELYLTTPIAELRDIDGVMFSGGVAEYVYHRESRDFGDLGRRLGHALRRRIDAGELPWPLLPPGECIRATAVGASEYSVQLSGNTCYISDPGELLPRRNLQVIQPRFDARDGIDAQKLAAAIREHRAAFDAAGEAGDIALALRWHGPPTYERIAAFARGIHGGLADRIARGRPIFVMLDGDIAQTLGAILREEMHVAGEILVIDGLTLWDFDYVDLGRLRVPSNTVPVTIKSLVFSQDPRAPHTHGHHHSHGHGEHPHHRGSDGD